MTWAASLDRLLRRASWIGQDEPDVPAASFTSVFLALFTSDDEFSRWAQDKATWIGPSLEHVIRRWNATSRTPGRDPARVVASRNCRDEDLAAQAVTMTASIEGVLAEARTLWQRVGAEGEIEVRHVFAAYLYAAEAHRDDLAAWRVDREAWATRFRCHMAAGWPDEAAGWRAIHDEAFPRPFSAGVASSRRWASALATHRSPPEAEIDSGLVLAGMLRDGSQDSGDAMTTGHLVKYLGGAEKIAPLIGPLPDDVAPGKELPFASELAPIFDRALIFAAAMTTERHPRQVHVRHVLAALLIDRSPLPAFDLLRRAGRTADGLLAQLVGPMCEVAGCDPARMRAVLDELREAVLAGYDNDEASGEDRLAIGGDVRALAAVLASTQITPPLSVGLFGDWGTGKSFFMKKLRERVDQLAGAARAREHRESWFCGQKGKVLQIEFNAWHYTDSDLWSSLAANVFDRLSREFKSEFARACVAELDSLQERQEEIKAEQRTLDKRAGALDGELARQRRLRASRKLELADYVAGLKVEVVREIAASPRVAEICKQLRLDGQAGRVELEQLRHDLATFEGRVRRWWQTLQSPVRLAAAAASFAVPVLVAGAIWLVAGAAWGSTATVTSVLGVLAVIRQRASRALGPTARLIDGALDDVDRIEAAARDKQGAEEQRVELERDQVSARVATLEREQLELTKRRAELDVQLASLGDAGSLKDFVLRRAASDDYRKRLGVVSAVHRDFQQLAKFLAPGQEGPDVERIILYIDDLDRCPPPRVVEVLQAVHVMLSLPLFVVVVGVDSRWLLDSLGAYYRQQFPAEVIPADKLRPQQYLEKIFQISLTLMPMTQETYGSLVGAILERHTDAPPGAEVIADEIASRRLAAGSAAPAAPSVPASPGRQGREAEARVDLTPRSLRIEPAELAHLKQLNDLIASPRAAKRFINLYRMIRAMLDDEALDRLITGGYRITQVCLAVVIGSPALGAELFEAILSGRITSRSELVDWCTDRTSKVEGTRERRTLRHVTRRDGEFTDWDAVCEAVRRVARFSFETGSVLRHYS
ncbi:MAG TPA: P-loop NTPase fold protein [Kofleriaceae bacterium]